MKHRALIVEDSADFREDVVDRLSSLGHECHAAGTQVEAEALLKQSRFSYVLMDLELPYRAGRGPDVEVGYRLLANIRERFTESELPVIVMTAHGSDHVYCRRAMRFGAEFAKKPFNQEGEDLDAQIRRLVEGRRPPPAGASADLEMLESLRFVGQRVGRARYSLVVNGATIDLPRRLFLGFARLGAYRASRGDSLLGKGEVFGKRARRGLYDLKKALEERARLDPATWLVVDEGKIRLALEPSRISFDEDAMDEPEFWEILDLLKP